MFFIDIQRLEGLGNHTYLAGGRTTAVVVDPPRDIDRILAVAARRGVRITHVVETHLHNDYLSGGLLLAQLTGARYLVPAGAGVAFERVPVEDGETVTVDEGLTLHSMATPGHTPHHTAYVLADDGEPVVVFTGGSLLIGAVGRPDLVEPRLTERLARAQHASAHRLAARLGDDVAVLPTHGFGSFCTSGRATSDSSTIGRERRHNDVLLKGVDAFVADMLAELDDIPAYYAYMSPANAAGPPPVDLTDPRRADAREIAHRLAAGEWVVDLRARTAFAEGHVPGSFNIEADGRPATYLAWLMPWGKPVTLLGDDIDQVAAVQRELARVGIHRPVAAATGGPTDWVTVGANPASFGRATFADLARSRRSGADLVVLDVRRDAERATGFLDGSAHLPIHRLYGRAGDVPAGTVWVHCTTGMRATMGASLLDAVGRDVVVVDDEFDAAGQAGLPVVDGPG